MSGSSEHEGGHRTDGAGRGPHRTGRDHPVRDARRADRSHPARVSGFHAGRDRHRRPAAYLGILGIMGAVGVVAWLTSAWLIRRGTRHARTIVSTIFAAAVAVTATLVFIEDTSGEVGLAPGPSAGCNSCRASSA